MNVDFAYLLLSCWRLWRWLFSRVRTWTFGSSPPQIPANEYHQEGNNERENVLTNKKIHNCQFVSNYRRQQRRLSTLSQHWKIHCNCFSKNAAVPASFLRGGKNAGRLNPSVGEGRVRVFDDIIPFLRIVSPRRLHLISLQPHLKCFNWINPFP